MRTNSVDLVLKSIFSLAIILFLTGYAASQNNFNIQIPWTTPLDVVVNDESIKVPRIENQELSGASPHFFWRTEIENGALNEIVLTTLTTKLASQFEVSYLDKHDVEIGDLNYELRISNARDSRYGVLNMLPYVKKNGKIHKVMSFTIELKKGAIVSKAPTKDFVSNSVLAPGSGFWYKIAVTADGIHRIDYAFLEMCLAGTGIDISTISPDDINIFGNGEGKLPEKNSDFRTDDLAKNAIQIIGDGDGSFDANDYILFYAWGPHRWDLTSSNDFDRDQHIYSDQSCYFININSSDTPLRIQSESSSPGVVTHNVNTYNFRDIHEIDGYSLVHGGQRWYGELFDGGDLSQSFAFNVPNIDNSEPVYFQSWMAANAGSGSGNTQTFSVGGTQLFTGPLPATSADFKREKESFQMTSAPSNMILNLTVQRNSPDVLTYLDRIVLNARANLTFGSGQLSFRDLNSVGAMNISEFTISNMPANGKVWDITHKQTPKLIDGLLTGSDYTFQVGTDSLREFVAYDASSFRAPTHVGEVGFQDIHGLPQADYIIVTHPAFIAQAQRLASLHEGNGLVVHVVTTDDVYNEFSSGVPDATAIKFMAKMFYDRGVILPNNRIQHLLLFGDGTYDPKNRVPNNNNFVLAYEVLNSESHISATVADDYYGMLDDTDGNQSGDLLDIGVGRLLISDTDMAKEQVDKIEHYMENGSSLYATSGASCGGPQGESTFGDWRTRYVQVADDEEGGYFIKIDSEPHYLTIKDSFPDMNSIKIYLDAYQQTITAGGQRYPDVVRRIDEEINRGCLVFCYVGHGGEVGVAEERVITVPQIQGWKNIHTLPLIVSATCEFTKFDDPSRVSAGEWASINAEGGAIALMTTTRSIFFGTNSQMTSAFYDNVFLRDSNFKPRAFGDIISDTKNAVGGTNKRSFTLIGDPALRIALPEMKVVTDSINGYSPDLYVDTLMALSKVKVKGHLEDFYGNVLNSYDGEVLPTVYDKPKMQETLASDPTSPVLTFELQNSKLYKGRASVNSGYFEFEFVVPKDIDFAIDSGKISYYSNSSDIDGIGSETRVMIGGIDPNGINDDTGPDIDLFMNDLSFVNGGMTDESPLLIVDLFDENGINSSGSGIGHDLVAILDGESGNPIVLNDYYEADLDSYQSGEIRYRLVDLEPGAHQLSVKVWDVNNNSSEATIDFVVQESVEMALDHVLNYPNPFTTSTEFYFEHNQVCSELEAQIQVFTVSGRLVKTINELVMTEGFRTEGIPWDGRDDFGDQLGKGVYIYRLKVKGPEGTTADKTEKLVILK